MAMTKTRMKFTNPCGFVRVLMHRDVMSVKAKRHPTGWTVLRCRYSIVSSLPEYVDNDIAVGAAALRFERATDILKRMWEKYVEKHPEMQLYPFAAEDRNWGYGVKPKEVSRERSKGKGHTSSNARPMRSTARTKRVMGANLQAS